MNYALVENAGYGELVQRWLFLLLAIMMSLIVTSPAMAKRANGGLAGGVVPTPVLAPAVVPAQFDIVGFIQQATVNPTMCPAVTDPRLKGGTVKLNGQTIIVPCNTILQMPAFALTWADLWTMSPKDTTPTGSGLALSNVLTPGTLGLLSTPWSDPNTGLPTNYNAALPSHEIHVQGNIINGQYIAGLIFIAQQSLNSAQGVISCIDYATGEMQVGGTLLAVGTTPCPTPAQLAASGQQVTRVRINDPIGRYGIVHGGPRSVGADVIEPGYDPRYTADTDNPTIHSALGFPVCIPTINPVSPITNPITGAAIAAGIDPLCPMYNRPIAPNCKSFDPLTTLPAFGGQPAGYCMTWVMDAPGAHTAATPNATDPTVAAPLAPGDYITFSGNLIADANGPYISANTLAANLGIYTQPHTQPAYVIIEKVGVGTGGANVGGLAAETTLRVFWVGFSSDVTELVDFFAVHQDPVTGASTEFYQGTEDPCCTPLGRFRSVVNNLGAFGDPTRNYRAVSRTMCQPPGVNGPRTPQLQTICHMDPLAAPNPSATQATVTRSTNGLVMGQFTLPNFGFIFPENLNFGTPVVPMNFQDMPFLFCGSGPVGGPGSGTTVVGQLDPAPWALPLPDPVFHSVLCPTALAVGASAAVVVAAAPKPPVINSMTATPASTTVGKLTTVALAVSATNPNTPPTALSFAWTVPAGVVMSCGVCAPNANNATVTATFNPTNAGTLTFLVTVSNGVLPSTTASAFVLVAAATTKAPVVRTQGATPTGTVNVGALVTLSATGNTNPTGGRVTVSFRQTGGPAVTLSTVTMTGTPPADQIGKATFTVPFGPATQFTFVATATDPATGLTASSGTITVKTAAAPTDVVAITAVAYRTIANVGGQVIQKGKLTVTAASSANPAPIGMTMIATYVNNTLPANVPGSTALPLSLPLILQAADLPGTITPVCPGTPCWTGQVLSVINNTSVTPAVLVVPTSVTVKSSLGGTGTMLNTNPLFVIK